MDRSVGVEKLFLDRTSRVLNTSHSNVRRALVNRPFRALRLNRNSTYSIDSIRALLLTRGIHTWPLSWYAEVLLFDSVDTKSVQELLRDHPTAYIIQNPSSYIPVFALEPRNGERIFDMCAAPGAKTSHILSLTRGQSEIVANEPKPKRINKLHDLLGQQNTKLTITEYDGTSIEPREVGLFDKVLIDADCSGEAEINFLSYEPLVHWSPNQIKRMARIQKEMIIKGFKLLKPGGRLVYSTCTFAPEENEFIIQHLLENEPLAQVIPLSFSSEKTVRPMKSWSSIHFSEDIQGCLRIMPGEYMEGFFVCVVEKRVNPSEPPLITIEDVIGSYL